MGFDIECIIDIHTYPGEYFCPACRTLVFPNDAVQSQCTHLYCKPCLAHVANGSRACPYDGYLVTEADSKPLIESDKTLAESIGRVKVRCLYHRSGCTWEGPLSDCNSHCSGCSFGNSPVICNRCGVQIVHRQVHEHAFKLSCEYFSYICNTHLSYKRWFLSICSIQGVYPAQQTANGAQDNPSSGAATIAAGADSNQTTAHSGTPASHTPKPSNYNFFSASWTRSQSTNKCQLRLFVTASTGVPTSEQWYQQQYQQYYQQYAGYDPYQQQTYQTILSYQQQPIQQYQQQPQIYMQPPAQLPDLSPSPTSIPAPASQPQPQPLNPQTQPQMQGSSGHSTTGSSLAQQHQNQVQVNPQQQLPPTMQPHSKFHHCKYIQLLMLTATYSASTISATLSNSVHSQQHVQVPQYQQPPAQVHPVFSSSTASSCATTPFTTSTANVQISSTISWPIAPPQASQPAHVLGQALHSTANAVSGFHSYPQPQPMQQVPTGMTQQPPMHPHPVSGSMPPVQTHGQVPQQPLNAHRRV
ncbi:hypothetical protein HAX54_008010 [Datura stramonium]|uniref:RING-type domain-containing protein n=1 Tax=Datura stramonium TaxID=4076 RepID=A0ABS8WXQ5_DATST|nr:hypothetical protein [Datura stramonium]